MSVRGWVGEWVCDALSHIFDRERSGLMGMGEVRRGEGGWGKGYQPSPYLNFSCPLPPHLYIFCLMCAYMYLYDQQLIQKCQTGLQSLYIML